jgi:hypothetical protein
MKVDIAFEENFENTKTTITVYLRNENNAVQSVASLSINCDDISSCYFLEDLIDAIEKNLNKCLENWEIKKND